MNVKEFEKKVSDLEEKMFELEKDFTESREADKKQYEELLETHQALQKENGVLQNRLKAYSGLEDMIDIRIDERMSKEVLEGKTWKPVAIHINDEETKVSITHSETVKEFTTANQKGQLMYALVNDLKGGPASSSEIISAMAEHGWAISVNAFSPRVGELVKEGFIITEGSTKSTRYRVPGKIKLDVKE